MWAKIKRKQNLAKWLIIILGTVSLSLTMIKSGLVYGYGMGFWGPNGHDGIWHIALIESLFRGSRGMPVFSGELLQNYHLGFDLFLAFLHRITRIPVVNLYFQIIPPLFAFLIGYLTYKFVKIWQKSEKKAFWSTFFVYFGGSFGWLVTLLRDGKVGGESMFWSQQAISTLVNPPFAMSLIFLLLGLINVSLYLEENKSKNLYLSVIFLGALIQVKVYAGLLVLGGLFVTWVYLQYKKNRSGDLVPLIKMRNIFLGSLFFSIVLFYSSIKNGASLIVFRPFWFLENMMALSDRFGWQRFYSAMTNYRLAGEWLKATAAYIIAFFIFYYGNVGTRLIAEFGIARWMLEKKMDWMKTFSLSIILAGVIIPTFFLQKGTPWNTIQFFYYSLFFLSILAGVSLVEMMEKIKDKAVMGRLMVVIALFTVPTTFGTFRHYLPERPPAKISNEELDALRFLSEQPDGVVLSYPFDRLAAKAAEANPPRPLYLYESTAYISAFGKKDVYLEDEVNLDITRYDWMGKRNEVEEFLSTSNQKKAREFLSENNISYIYWVKGQRAKLGEGQLRLKQIFENGEIFIYKVDDKL